jgi:opacity protein-like surface antigen
MKRKFLSFACVLSLLCLSVNSFAQDKAIKANTESGTLAFIASLNGPGTFGISGPSGNGSNDPRITEGFGLRYYFGDNWSIRGLASFANQTDGKDSAAKKTTLFGLGAAVEYHIHQLYSTDIYVSGGAGYTTINTHNLGLSISFKPDQGFPTPQATTDEELSVSAFGITVAGGFDWYLWHGVALGAEYSLGWITSSATHTLTDGTKKDVPFGSGLGISGGANIHLIVTL